MSTSWRFFLGNAMIEWARHFGPLPLFRKRRAIPRIPSSKRASSASANRCCAIVSTLQYFRLAM
jgi:hypothetical protein